MESHLNLGDPNLVENIVSYLKTVGIFDELSRECLADVDTKSSCQNLSQRVDLYAAKFLANETFNPDLSKDEVRNKLQKYIDESDILTTGADHIVEQVINPKIQQKIPSIMEVVHEYLYKEKEKLTKKQEIIDSQKITDILSFIRSKPVASIPVQSAQGKVSETTKVEKKKEEVISQTNTPDTKPKKKEVVINPIKTDTVEFSKEGSSVPITPQSFDDGKGLKKAVKLINVEECDTGFATPKKAKKGDIKHKKKRVYKLQISEKPLQTAENSKNKLSIQESAKITSRTDNIGLVSSTSSSKSSDKKKTASKDEEPCSGGSQNLPPKSSPPPTSGLSMDGTQSSQESDFESNGEDGSESDEEDFRSPSSNQVSSLKTNELFSDIHNIFMCSSSSSEFEGFNSSTEKDPRSETPESQISDVSSVHTSDLSSFDDQISDTECSKNEPAEGKSKKYTLRQAEEILKAKAEQKRLDALKVTSPKLSLKESKAAEKASNTTRFKKLLEFSKSCMSATPEEKCEIVKNLYKVMEKANPSYINSAEFASLIDDTLKKIKDSKKNTFIHLLAIKTELKAYKRRRNTLTPAKPRHLASSSEQSESVSCPLKLGLSSPDPSKVVSAPILGDHLASALYSVTSNLTCKESRNSNNDASYPFPSVPFTSKQADVIENLRLKMPDKKSLGDSILSHADIIEELCRSLPGTYNTPSVIGGVDKTADPLPPNSSVSPEAVLVSVEVNAAENEAALFEKLDLQSHGQKQVQSSGAETVNGGHKVTSLPPMPVKEHADCPKSLENKKDKIEKRVKILEKHLEAVSPKGLGDKKNLRSPQNSASAVALSEVSPPPEPKRESRRKRKLNKKYSSSEYSSIFDSKRMSFFTNKSTQIEVAPAVDFEGKAAPKRSCGSNSAN